jgi:hypothetical protein
MSREEDKNNKGKGKDKGQKKDKSDAVSSTGIIPSRPHAYELTAEQEKAIFEARERKSHYVRPNEPTPSVTPPQDTRYYLTKLKVISDLNAGVDNESYKNARLLKKNPIFKRNKKDNKFPFDTLEEAVAAAFALFLGDVNPYGNVEYNVRGNPDNVIRKCSFLTGDIDFRFENFELAQKALGAFLRVAPESFLAKHRGKLNCVELEGEFHLLVDFSAVPDFLECLGSKDKSHSPSRMIRDMAKHFRWLVGGFSEDLSVAEAGTKSLGFDNISDQTRRQVLESSCKVRRPYYSTTMIIRAINNVICGYADCGYSIKLTRGRHVPLIKNYKELAEVVCKVVKGMQPEILRDKKEKGAFLNEIHGWYADVKTIIIFKEVLRDIGVNFDGETVSKLISDCNKQLLTHGVVNIAPRYTKKLGSKEVQGFDDPDTLYLFGTIVNSCFDIATGRFDNEVLDILKSYMDKDSHNFTIVPMLNKLSSKINDVAAWYCHPDDMRALENLFSIKISPRLPEDDVKVAPESVKKAATTVWRKSVRPGTVLIDSSPREDEKAQVASLRQSGDGLGNKPFPPYVPSSSDSLTVQQNASHTNAQIAVTSSATPTGRGRSKAVGTRAEAAGYFGDAVLNTQSSKPNSEKVSPRQGNWSDSPSISESDKLSVKRDSSSSEEKKGRGF